LKIEVENYEPLVDFRFLRDQLVQQNEKFSPESLPQVPYEQLFLCCTGEAGAARCGRSLIVAERLARRARFVNMETDESAASRTYLQVNQMDEDVRCDQTVQSTPRWGDLNARQQTWAKLNCIANHIDDPALRLKEAILLLRECASQRVLPPEVAMSYMPRLRGLLTVYPGRITDQLFRTKITEIADALFEFLDEHEVLALQREEIRNYSCTSDCYRVLI
jgi:hypothetical protein